MENTVLFNHIQVKEKEKNECVTILEDKIIIENNGKLLKTNKNSFLCTRIEILHGLGIIFYKGNELVSILENSFIEVIITAESIEVNDIFKINQNPNGIDKTILRVWIKDPMVIEQEQIDFKVGDLVLPSKIGFINFNDKENLKKLSYNMGTIYSISRIIGMMLINENIHLKNVKELTTIKDIETSKKLLEYYETLVFEIVEINGDICKIKLHNQKDVSTLDINDITYQMQGQIYYTLKTHLTTLELQKEGLLPMINWKKEGFERG